MSPDLTEITTSAAWRRYDTDGAHSSQSFPTDYDDVIRALGAGEGFVGAEFVRLYEPSRLPQLGAEYGFAEYLPGIALFGSNGCGEAYAYDTRAPRSPVVKVPFVPLELEYVERVAASLEQMLLRFVRNRPPEFREVPNPALFRKEIDQVHPLCLGGSPTDPKNQYAFDLERHIEVCSYWNRTYRVVKAQTPGGT